MASIPLPELSLQPPQAPDLLGQYARLMQIREAMQQQQYQQQMQPLELQSKQLDVQTQQRQMQSQQALQDALIANPTAAPDDLMQTAMKNGGYPGDILPTITNLKQSQKLTGDLRGQQLDQAQKLNDTYGQYSQMLTGIQDPQQRQQTWQSVVAPGLQRMGLPANQIPQQVPDDQTLQAHAASAMRADQQMDQARKNQEYEQAHGIIDPARLGQINQMLTSRWQALHGSQPVPATYQLGKGATYDDFTRTDKVMEQTERAEATQAQLQTANAIRGQTYQLAAQGRDEQDYNRNLSELNTTFKPVVDTLPRLARLQATLAQNSPQADALVAPELLSVMAGGPGSGVRMNEAEINRIVGGRSNWQNLQAAAQKWSLDPTAASSITPAQRLQIRGLVNAVQDKLQQQQNAYSTARQQLIGTSDPAQRRQIVANASEQSMRLNSAPQAGGAGGGGAASVPANVQKALSTVGVGRHTLSDGSTWDKHPDGTIVPVPPGQ